VLASGATRIVVAVSERGVQVDPLANRWPANGKLRLHGRLLGRRSQPSIEVIAPDGKWTTLRAKVAKNEFTADVTCDRGRGSYQVEILAEGAYGPEVVANFPVYCGTAPPGSLRFDIETVGPGVSVADVARSNFAALNNTRARQGLAALQWDNAAAGVAEGHSRDMASHGSERPQLGRRRARQVRLPLADRQRLELVHRRVELGDRRVPVLVVALLLGLARDPVLLQQRLEHQPLGDPEHRLHHLPRHLQRQERDLEAVEVEQEERARGLLVDRQAEAPVLDLPVRVRPLVRVLIAELHRVDVGARAVDEDGASAARRPPWCHTRRARNRPRPAGPSASSP
jgi:hypothetical protein